MQLNCFQCGEEFDGRPHRLYCSLPCKRSAEYTRLRIVSLQAREQHTRRMIDLARLSGTPGQLHAHRLLTIARELDALTQTVPPSVQQRVR